MGRKARAPEVPLTDLDKLLAVDPAEVAQWNPEQLALYAAALDRAYMLASPDRWGERTIHGFVRYPHVQLMGAEIADMIERDTADILVLEVSVRHGKSFCSSIATPGWFLSKYPDRIVGLASYEADFAAQWGRKTREAIGSPTVRQHFGVEVSKQSSAMSRWDLVTADGRTAGGMWTAGAGGPIEGKGYHLGIVDDPIKNREVADSQEALEKIWDWWQATLIPRGEPGNKLIVVMSRWSDADLIGRLRAASENSEYEGKRLRVVRMPAMADEDEKFTAGPKGSVVAVQWERKTGEPLCPERYDIDDLSELRASVGPWTWAARYQQTPAPRSGGIFKSEWFRSFTTVDDGYLLDLGNEHSRLVDPDDCYRFVTVDLAFTRRKHSDFTAAAHWAVAPQTFDQNGEVVHPTVLIWTGLDRVKIEGAQHLELLRRAWEWEPRPAWVGVEQTTAGIAIIAQARRDGIPVRELKPDRNKAARAETAATLMMAGRVFFPADAEWLWKAQSELLLFPNGRNDDVVDVLAYAANEVVRGQLPQGRWKGYTGPITVEEKIRAQIERQQSGAQSDRHPILGRI